MLYHAKLPYFIEVAKKKCSHFIEACSGFILFWKSMIYDVILQRKKQKSLSTGNLPQPLQRRGEKDSWRTLNFEQKQAIFSPPLEGSGEAPCKLTTCQLTKMGKRVRISNDSLNSYGFRVLTSGLDVAQYNRNPVLLYMHERGNVVGYVNDLKVENGEVTGELMFDCASELSQRCEKQFEFGSLRMVSAGLEILETSEDASMLVQGQTHPTITKSKLFEVSIADVGANDDAIVLQRNGKIITLGRDGNCDLPLLNNNNKQKTKEMENKTIALNLGLPETATEAEISAKIAELNAVKEQNASLLQEKEKLTLARINSLVEQAIANKRIELNNKDQFVELGKKIGAEELEKTLRVLHPAVRLSSVLGHQGGATDSKQEITKLSQVPASQLATLRSENPEEYKRLYKAEYGIECQI